MEVDSLTFNDYIDVFRRRRWSFIVPFCAVVVTALAIALLLPSRYMSTAKILIEEQEIPYDYVRTTVSSYAEQRVQAIKQRIMSTARLVEIVNRLDLYGDLREKKPIEEIISKMRKDIKIENINADVVNRRTGRAMAATIAFTLSYDSDNPEKTQQVTNLLTSMFLEENLKIRKRQTTETTEFLEKEMGKIEKDLTVVENQIAVFKEKYINELPSLLQLNIQSLQGLELKKERLQEDLLSKKERQEYIKSQLANIPEAGQELADQKRLEQLETLLVNLQSQFTAVYPDVVKLKAEIAELNRKIASNPAEVSGKKGYLDNPAHVNLKAQQASIVSEINSLQRQISEYAKKEDDYRARIETSLRVEEEYRALIIKRDNTQAKHNDLMKKLMEAKVSFGLEEEQKGERFTLLDPANYPGAPYKPNRLMIVMLGFVAGFGVGTGMIALREYTDHSIRDVDMLARATGFPVLGSIPVIITQEDIARKRWQRALILVGVLLIIAGVIVILNYFFSFEINLLLDKILQPKP